MRNNRSITIGHKIRIILFLGIFFLNVFASTEVKAYDYPKTSTEDPNNQDRKYQSDNNFGNDLLNNDNFEIIDDKRIEIFTILAPQLKDPQKNIFVYLPPDYPFEAYSYPVIYLQNAHDVFIFNRVTNEWHLNTSMLEFYMKDLHSEAIIVGVEDKKVPNWDEYSPWVNEDMYAWMDPYDANRSEGGDGDDYLDFLTQTLKPEIDNRYRTNQDRENTAIAGSKMGGLIALYAGITRSETFSHIMAISPSIWFAEDGGAWLSNNRLISLIDTLGAPRDVSFTIDVADEDRTSELVVRPAVYDNRGNKITFPRAYLEGVQSFVHALVIEGLSITKISGRIQNPNEWTQDLIETQEPVSRATYEIILPLIYNPPIPPAITSRSATNFVIEHNNAFTITATGKPSPSFTITGTLPDGVEFLDNGDGTAELSGYLPKQDTNIVYPITIVADNGFSQTDIQYFELLVTDPNGLACPSNKSCLLNFDMSMYPFLDRIRRVWVYLPPYYNTSGKDYQVIYLTDAQHIFGDEAGAPLEPRVDWTFDEKLDDLYAEFGKGTIAVAIEFDTDYEWDEYTPWTNNYVFNWMNIFRDNYGSDFIAGVGDELLHFIVYELKPVVDSSYRTLPDRENTAIGGGSRCALFALYGGLRRSDVFSKVMAMSPAIWIAENSSGWLINNGLENWFDTFQTPKNVRYYLYIGTNEGGAGGYPLAPIPPWSTVYVQGTDMVKNKFINEGVTSYLYRKNVGGTHDPGTWSAYIKASLDWLGFY